MILDFIDWLSYIGAYQNGMVVVDEWKKQSKSFNGKTTTTSDLGFQTGFAGSSTLIHKRKNGNMGELFEKLNADGLVVDKTKFEEATAKGVVFVITIGNPMVIECDMTKADFTMSDKLPIPFGSKGAVPVVFSITNKLNWRIDDFTDKGDNLLAFADGGRLSSSTADRGWNTGAFDKYRDFVESGVVPVQKLPKKKSFKFAPINGFSDATTAVFEMEMFYPATSRESNGTRVYAFEFDFGGIATAVIKYGTFKDKAIGTWNDTDRILANIVVDVKGAGTIVGDRTMSMNNITNSALHTMHINCKEDATLVGHFTSIDTGGNSIKMTTSVDESKGVKNPLGLLMVQPVVLGGGSLEVTEEALGFYNPYVVEGTGLSVKGNSIPIAIIDSVYKATMDDCGSRLVQNSINAHILTGRKKVDAGKVFVGAEFLMDKDRANANYSMFNEIGIGDDGNDPFTRSFSANWFMRSPKLREKLLSGYLDFDMSHIPTPVGGGVILIVNGYSTHSDLHVLCERSLAYSAVSVDNMTSMASSIRDTIKMAVKLGREQIFIYNGESNTDSVELTIAQAGVVADKIGNLVDNLDVLIGQDASRLSFYPESFQLLSNSDKSTDLAGRVLGIIRKAMA